MKIQKVVIGLGLFLFLTGVLLGGPLILKKFVPLIGADSIGPNIAYVFSKLSSQERFLLFISFCLLFSGLITIAAGIIMVIIIISKRNKANGVKYEEK
ncbi:MAG: hypothetical protein ACYSWZ_05375 [Planctomycetota bacterium]|jgi:hypothetical protein